MVMSDMPTDVRAHNERLIEQFRANGRRLGDRPLLLLNTTGARTGKPRTTPMMYVLVNERLLVIASNAGAPRHPDWFRNVVMDPHVTVEHDGEVFDAIAVVATGAERDRLFGEVARRYPFFADHQAGVARQIPVVALERV
jgi:deazaflavin-dependent oxidoreductase (nitroreductase family)